MIRATTVARFLNLTSVIRPTPTEEIPTIHGWIRRGFPHASAASAGSIADTLYRRSPRDEHPPGSPHSQLPALTHPPINVRRLVRLVISAVV